MFLSKQCFPSPPQPAPLPTRCRWLILFSDKHTCTARRCVREGRRLIAKPGRTLRRIHCSCRTILLSAGATSTCFDCGPHLFGHVSLPKYSAPTLLYGLKLEPGLAGMQPCSPALPPPEKLPVACSLKCPLGTRTPHPHPWGADPLTCPALRGHARSKQYFLNFSEC